MAGVGFRLLGEVGIAGATDAGSPKQRVVLAALLLAGGRPVPVDALVAAVWDEDPPARSRNVLATYVSRLRRVLDRLPDGPQIHHHSTGYSLVCAPESVDVVRFRAAAGRARHADDAAAVALFDEALDCWRGAPLAGLPGRWAAGAADRLTREYRDMRAARIDALLRLGRAPDVLDELHQLVVEHPLDEEFTAQLMAALDAVGRGADAIARYQALRERLVEELGVDPSPPVQEAYVALLRRAAPAYTEAAPAQLPADVAAFVGRTRQLAELDRVLDTADTGTTVVISAIAGTAGVGKTALALRWGHGVRSRFPDGQLFANLRGYATGPAARPIEVLAPFLRALGVPPERVPLDETEAAALYRTLVADRRLLIVLDNAHHPDQVRPLLPGSPGSVVVVTSRDSLAGLVARDGARTLSVDVLTPDEARALLEQVLGAPRTRAEPDAVDTVARACAYLPLALRIAAAHLVCHPGTGIGAYAAELVDGDRLGALEITGDSHAGVRSAFDLSYLRLDAAARRLFRLLAVVLGPDVTAEAAAALLDTTARRAGALLAQLARAHLVDQPAPGRYAMHDLLRRYAAELSGSERHDAAARLHGYYLSAVSAAGDLLYPHMVRLPDAAQPARPRSVAFADHEAASAWLDAERANLVVTVRAGPPPVAVPLADGLRGFLFLRMHTADWLAVGEAALAAAEAGGDDRGQAAAHLSLATLHSLPSRYRQSIDHYDRAAELARLAGWTDGEAAALTNVANMHCHWGNPEHAIDGYRLALALSADRAAGRAVNLRGLGAAYRDTGRLAEAVEVFGRALDEYRAIGSPTGEAGTLMHLGEAYHALGELDRAESTLDTALAMHEKLDDPNGRSATLSALARVHADTGRLDSGLRMAGRATALARDTGFRLFEALGRHAEATIRCRLGEHRLALAGHGHAASIARDIHCRAVEADAEIGLATAQHLLGDLEAAGHHISAALAICRGASLRVLEGQALALLASIEPVKPE